MRTTILAILTLTSVTGFALTLKEQKQLKYVRDYMTGTESYREKAKKNCGYDIPVNVDEKMVGPFMSENVSLVLFCDGPRSVVGDMCEDETSKAVIKKNIKKIECKLGKGEENVLKLAGGTLTVTIGTKAHDSSAAHKEWLENNMK